MQFIVFGLFLASCDANQEYANLQEYIDSGPTSFSGVIACAASSKEAGSQVIDAFFYPRNGANVFQLFETSSSSIDPSDLTQYKKVDAAVVDVFGGKLRKYQVEKSVENYMIVTYEEKDTIYISDPIRTKQLTEVTEWNDEAVVNQAIPLKPTFSWDQVLDAAIYFQVISKINGDFLSGTYTYETEFTYEENENVVLSINTEAPPELIIGESYNFTIMSVSDDNWVIQVAEKAFVVE